MLNDASLEILPHVSNVECNRGIIMEPTENQIIVYQPNGVMKIDVRFDGETVWLLQPQIAELFSCSLENVRLHLKNIYACGELEKMATSKESLEVTEEWYDMSAHRRWNP